MLDSFSNCGLYSSLASIREQLVDDSVEAFLVNNGNIPKWQKAITELSSFAKSDLKYRAPYLSIDNNIDNIADIEKQLKQLIPWRKGPYKIGNLAIDSEWRCDLKWERISQHIQPLDNRTVLDVGSGNGYFTIMMALSGARIALGLDPFLLYNFQFQAIRCLINNPPNAFVLPLRLEQIPDIDAFDSVFSMGVLYHQKDHMMHLHKLKKMIASGGELILETLVIDSDTASDLVPNGRYARMRNVWMIPTISKLKSWLEDAGFSYIKLVDINKTSTKEQHSTPWIGNNSKSLIDFLDQKNQDLTVEGYPAPKRATFICRNL